MNYELVKIAREMYPVAFKNEYYNMTSEERNAKNEKLVAAIKNGVFFANAELLYVNMPMLLELAADAYGRFARCIDDFEDMLQTAAQALLESAENYDLCYAGKKASFYTYACKCVKMKLLSYGISNYRAGDCDSLDVPRWAEEDKDDRPLGELIPDPVTSDVIERMANTHGYAAAVLNLPEKERVIISMHIGLGGGEPMTHTDIARVLHISRQTENKYYKNACELIKEALFPAV